MSKLTRREALAVGGAVIAGIAGEPSMQAQSQREPSTRRRVLRLAHLTDMHVQPELAAGEGLAACLRHVQSMPDPPALILGGGDVVMDASCATRERAEQQAEVWRRIVKAECSLPIEHCLGNHDIWGMNKSKSHTTGDEPRWGKPWGLELLGMTQRYRVFDRAGWRFVVLDSTFVLPDGGYTAKLDEEQFDWLSRTLADTPPATPILVLSHIPILTATAYFDGDNEKSGNWVVPGAWMHIDARRIKSLFHKHANVKLCLSGHIHLLDRVDYLGVTYLCNGAVCGGWWKGPYQECDAGYAVVDLFDDGTFDHRYVTFGWKPRP